jgi:hypothetical protein
MDLRLTHYPTAGLAVSTIATTPKRRNKALVNYLESVSFTEPHALKRSKVTREHSLW